AHQTAGPAGDAPASAAVTPLLAAAAMGHMKGRLHMSTLLLEKGGPPLESRDPEGRTALHVASWRGHVDAVDLLLKHGADPNAQDVEGRPPLHSAAWTGRVDVGRRLLLASTVDINLACHQGATALSVAAQQGRADVVALLLEGGADPNHVDKHGRGQRRSAGSRAEGPHLLIDGAHGRVGVTVAARPVSDLAVGQPLVGGPLRPRRDEAQDLQVELQRVVGRGGRQADAGHLVRRLHRQRALRHRCPHGGAAVNLESAIRTPGRGDCVPAPLLLMRAVQPALARTGMPSLLLSCRASPFLTA
uniref:Uncharacterized protein n=1 Tax=Hippocampus comes TaxID=109280 RepID=A0A3Q2XH14_HIPCM